MKTRTTDDNHNCDRNCTPGELERWTTLLERTPGVYSEKVRRSRAAVRANHYDNPQVLDATVERLIRDISSSR